MQVNITADGLDQLVKDLRKYSETPTKEFGAVAWKVGKKGQTMIARGVSKEVNISQRDAKSIISTRRLRPVGAEINVPKEQRYSLKRFSPSQVKAGVSVRVARKGRRRLIKGAFMGPNKDAVSLRLGGHVFQRAGKGRLPIFKVYGVSPWGVLVKNQMLLPSIRFKIEQDLKEQLRRRLDFRKLKRSGAI